MRTDWECTIRESTIWESTKVGLPILDLDADKFGVDGLGIHSLGISTVLDLPNWDPNAQRFEIYKLGI